MPQLRLYLLGMPQLALDGSPIKVARRKALSLAAWLALADHPQSRDSAASFFWPEMDEDHARSSLRTALRALTTPVPFPWVQADRMTLALDRDAVWVDVDAFLAAIRANDTHGHDAASTCERCIANLRAAAALYRSDFMAGFQLAESGEYDDWQSAQREWLRREYAAVLRKLAYYYFEARQYETALADARNWLAVDPLHEPAHRLLMRIYAANGQRVEALRQYKQCAEILEAELGTRPEAETTQLYDALLVKQFRALNETNPPTSLRAGVLPPLPSLVVGRDAVLQALRERLGAGSRAVRPVTVLQGWPGVGKSTTVAMLAHDPDINRVFPDGVLWTSLCEAPDIHAELTSWALALGIGDEARVATTDSLRAQVTAALRDLRVLLLVDDVWNAEHAAPFRVGGQHCALVMSTRLNDVAGALAPAADDIFRLPVLGVDAGLALLRKLSPEAVADNMPEARELVVDLEGLPLAILVAGRLLQNEARLGWGVRELLAELRTGAALLAAQPPSDMLGVERDTRPTVAALLKRSSDLLDPETRAQFAMLGLFVPKPATFDLEALSIAWDVADPRPTTRSLVNRGMLEPVPGGRFQMHALLVAHARSLLAGEGYSL